MSDQLIPVDRFRPLVEQWVARFESPTQAYAQLEAGGAISADGWRRRLSDGDATHQGWVFPVELDPDDVDEFLTAAGLTHLWQTELHDLLDEPRLSDEEFDETCAECGRWIDWARGDAGVRVEVKRPRRWTQWWSLCSLCACERLPLPNVRPGLRHQAPPVTEQQIRDLYRRYVLEQIGLAKLADTVYASLGFRNASSCASFLRGRWRRIGLPTRGISEAKILNHKHGYTWQSRFTRAELQAAHRLHMRADLSVNELGRRLFAKHGFKNHHSCAVAISDGWKKLDLQARDRIEMTVAASTIHGNCRRNGNSAAKKRFLAEQRGDQYDLPCSASTLKGKPCERPSLIGKDVCSSHDPERAERRRAHMARIRETSPSFQTVPWDQLPARIMAWFESNGRRWAPLDELTGKSVSVLGRFARMTPDGNTTPATRALLERALDDLERDRLGAAA